MMLYIYSETDCSRWLNSLQTTTVEYMLKQLNNFSVSSLTLLDTHQFNYAEDNASTVH